MANTRSSAATNRRDGDRYLASHRAGGFDVFDYGYFALHGRFAGVEQTSSGRDGVSTTFVVTDLKNNHLGPTFQPWQGPGAPDARGHMGRAVFKDTEHVAWTVTSPHYAATSMVNQVYTLLDGRAACLDAGPGVDLTSYQTVTLAATALPTRARVPQQFVTARPRALATVSDLPTGS